MRAQILLACFWLLLVAGCAGPAIIPQPEQAGFMRQDVSVPPFVLTAYSRITNPNVPVRIYIEGDGFAWVSRYEISSDPTPKKALGLLLAEKDTAPNVVYLARPCQFRNLSVEVCPNSYWTNKRFAEEVIHAMNQAVDRYAAQGNGKVELVGYSGGGAVATLIAARRTDVAWLVTVAGNLDHLAVNRHHKVTLTPESLNPADFKARLQGVPQTHFSGEKDKIILPWVAADFVRSMPCARQVVVQDATHEQGWLERWPELLKAAPDCSY